MDIFTQLSLLLVITTLVAALMRLFRQPLIVGYIITGVVIGPAFLNMLGDHEAFTAFSNLGIALLLFIIGLGLNTAIVRRLGRVVAITASVQIILTTLLTAIIGIGFGLTPFVAIIAGLALSFSSTIIIIKILNDKREQDRLYGQISIGILLIQDIIASLALLFVTTNQDMTLNDATLLLGKGVALAAGLIFVSVAILPRISHAIARSQEFLFLFALAWGFGVATLFEVAGFSLEVGALFAGVSLASLPYSHEMGARLKPLRDFFVVIFFIALGEELDLGNLFAALPLSLAFTVVVLLLKPLITLMTMGALAYTKRTSFKTALSLGQVSEFSLIFIVLAASEGLVPEYLSAALTLTAILSITISTYFMKYDDQLFTLLTRWLQFFERDVVQVERERRQKLQSYEFVLFGYRKGGTEFIKVFKELEKPFVVIDYDPDVITTLERRKLAYRYGDAADPELLEELQIEKAKVVIATITNFDTTLGLVRHIGVLNPQAMLICHADTYEQAADLYRVGATYVIMPHFISSERIGALLKHAHLSKNDFATYREQQLQAIAQSEQAAQQAGA